MPIQISVVDAIMIALCIIGVYYFLLYRMGIFKPQKMEPVVSQVVDNTGILPQYTLLSKSKSKMTLPPAIDLAPQEPELEPIDESELEIPDDPYTTLLKEAERLVDRIQETINHIASSPPNPEEVTSKIRAIISPYKFLLDTEYYDSINVYISLALERDCEIKLSPGELQLLWN